MYKYTKFLIMAIVGTALMVGTCFSVTAQRDITLTSWSFLDAYAEYYELKAEEFDEQNPDINFSIETEVLPFSELHDKLKISLQAGVGAPDLVDVEVLQSGAILEAASDSFIPMTDLVNKYKDDIVEARLSPYTYEGEVYGIPTHVGTLMMYYNKEVLEEVGVSPEDIETWDDFREVGKKVTQDTNGDGEVDRWMYPIETEAQWAFIFPARQFGSVLLNEEGEVVLDREENLKVFEMLHGFIHEDKIARTVSDVTDESFFEMLNNEEFAAIAYPQWYLDRMLRYMPDLEGKIYAAPLPDHEWSDKDKRSGMGGGTMTAATKEIPEEDRETVKEFLEFAKLTYDANVDIWSEHHRDPMRRDVYDDPKLAEENPYADYVANDVLEVIKGLQGEIQPLYSHGSLFLEFGDILTEKTLYEVLEEGEDPRAALKDLADTLRAMQD